MSLSESELIEVLAWALRRSLDWLEQATEPAPAIEIHKILSDNGMKFDKKGHLVEIRKIGFIQHD